MLREGHTCSACIVNARGRFYPSLAVTCCFHQALNRGEILVGDYNKAAFILSAMTGAGSSGSSAEEEGEEEEAMEVDEGITEHERLRLETIKENEAVLASLNLKNLATSLENSAVATSSVRKKKNNSLAVLGSSSGERRRSQRLSSVKSIKVVDWSSDTSEAASDSDEPKSGGKGKKQAKKKKQKRISLAKLDDLEEKKKDDVEYEPGENSDSEDFDEEDDSESEAEVEATRKQPPSRKPTTPVKRPRSRTLKSPVKRTISLNSPELFQKSPPPLRLSGGLDLDGDDDDDLALQQALALSMESSADMASPGSSRGTRGKRSPQTPQGQAGSNSARTRRRKALVYEESEIDAFFVSIVGNKDGRLSRRHLEKAASTHDFIWKDEEINDMIDMFDADGDGQLNLAEFRRMAKRSNLMEAS